MYSRQKTELDRLQAKVAKGNMSRREFLSRVSAMGLGAMAPGLYAERHGIAKTRRTFSSGCDGRGNQ